MNYYPRFTRTPRTRESRADRITKTVIETAQSIPPLLWLVLLQIALSVLACVIYPA